jgi:hypothetical protein
MIQILRKRYQFPQHRLRRVALELMFQRYRYHQRLRHRREQHLYRYRYSRQNFPGSGMLMGYFQQHLSLRYHHHRHLNRQCYLHQHYKVRPYLHQLM